MTAILSVLISFILITLLGNLLLQKWQRRSWFLQQRFIGEEKEYLAAQELVDQLSSKLAKRIYYSKRLLGHLRTNQSDNQQLDHAKEEYENAVKNWNVNLTSYFVRLPLYFNDNSLGNKLEKDIHHPLVAISQQISSELRAGQINISQLNELEAALTRVQVKSQKFGRKLLDLLDQRKKEIYEGRSISYAPSNFHHFSAWQLFKALFVRNIESHSVFCTPVDARFPLRRRSSGPRIN